MTKGTVAVQQPRPCIAAPGGRVALGKRGAPSQIMVHGATTYEMELTAWSDGLLGVRFKIRTQLWLVANTGLEIYTPATDEGTDCELTAVLRLPGVYGGTTRRYLYSVSPLPWR